MTKIAIQGDKDTSKESGVQSRTKDGLGNKKDNLAKTPFQIACENAISIEDARKISHDFIKELWQK